VASAAAAINGGDKAWREICGVIGLGAGENNIKKSESNEAAKDMTPAASARSKTAAANKHHRNINGESGGAWRAA